MKKQIAAGILAAAFLGGSLLAAGPTSASGRSLQAVETGTALARQVLSTSTAHNTLKKVSGQAYQADELVQVIVEVKGAPLLEQRAYMGKGKLRSANAARSRQALVDSHSSVKQAVQGVVARSSRARSVSQAEFLYDYTALLNGFAVRVPYGALSEIRKLDGVQAAFVAQKYDPPETNMETSGGMIGADKLANNTSYQGQGMKVAILDTGLDYKHEAFQADPENPAFSKSNIAAYLANNDLHAEETTKGLSADALYKRAKVPYQYDYADNDANVMPAKDGEHGTHVAGTIAADLSSTDKHAKVRGIAPESQLLIMKVFADGEGGAYDANIIAALEDAVILGADSINMSLGSSAGFTNDYGDYYDFIEKAYNRVANSGSVLDCSAGNAYSSGYNNASGHNLNLTKDPDNATVGSPSTYPAATSVASIENIKTKLSYFTIDDAGKTKVQYTDPAETAAGKFNAALSGTLDYVVVPGVGEAKDYAGLDLKGKVALVQRGGITFVDKSVNAKNAGAKGIVIYDNSPGALSNMVPIQLPGCFTTLANGQAMIAAAGNDKVGKLTISKDEGSFDNPAAGQMSDFSSWGVTPDLKLKPELTAPGGAIYSTVPGNAYESMSGTSMASPHVAGASAVVLQYVNTKFKNMDAVAKKELVDQLLMSTASPVAFPSSSETQNLLYSPRKQGAGLINVYNAVTSGAYLSVKADQDGNTRPKVNLGDDAAKKGAYTFSFQVHNISDKALSYQMKPNVQTETKDTDGFNDYILEEPTDLTDKTDVQYTASNATVKGDVLTVPAEETATVTVHMQLKDSAKQVLHAFPNGIFVEGFVQLAAQAQSGVSLTLPYMGFYGDWTKARIFDSANWFDETNTSVTGQVSGLYEISTKDQDLSGYFLGVNTFTDKQADAAHFVYSPNGDGYMDSIGAQMAMLRNSKDMRYTVKNKKTGTVYAQGNLGQMNKTVYDATYGIMMPAVVGDIWDGMDSKGQPVPSATEVEVTLTGSVDYKDGGATTNEKNQLSYPLIVDTKKPEIASKTYSIVVENGKCFLEVPVKDDNFIAVAMLGSADFSKVYAQQADVLPTKGGTAKLRMDITNVLGTTRQKVLLPLIDYALNEMDYELTLPTLSEVIGSSSSTPSSSSSTPSSSSSTPSSSSSTPSSSSSTPSSSSSTPSSSSSTPSGGGSTPSGGGSTPSGVGSTPSGGGSSDVQVLPTMSQEGQTSSGAGQSGSESPSTGDTVLLPVALVGSASAVAFLLLRRRKKNG